MTASNSGAATAVRASVASETNEQYSLCRILGIWALAVVPMGLLSWAVLPAASPDYRTDPFGASVVHVVLLTLGLIWQFILCMVIVRAETGKLRWAAVRRRLRLNVPRDPGTGEPRPSLWLWVIPLILAIAVWEIALAPYATRLWVSIFPFFAEPPGYSANSVFRSPEVLARLVGAWWFLGLFLISGVFNTVVGEELLFRGVLMPRMEGVFGRWSWVANGVLFGLYHVHQPWSMLANAISGTFLLAFPAWRFRSTWVSIIVHSVQTVFFAYLILGAVLGLA
jgi:membrane protease YdiL (CAAX protease family)